MKKLISALTAFLCILNVVNAQTQYFSAASNSVWSTSVSDWGVSGGPYTSAWVSGDKATFEGTGGTVTLGSNISAAGITFTATGYTIAAGTGPYGITLSGSPTINLSNATGFTDVIGAAITTGSGTTTISGSSGPVATFSGANSFGGAVSFGTSGGGNVTISGNNMFSSTLGFTGTGGPTYNFGGSNVFTGVVTIAPNSGATPNFNFTGSNTFTGGISITTTTGTPVLTFGAAATNFAGGITASVPVTIYGTAAGSFGPAGSAGNIALNATGCIIGNSGITTGITNNVLNNIALNSGSASPFAVALGSKAPSGSGVDILNYEGAISGTAVIYIGTSTSTTSTGGGGLTEFSGTNTYSGNTIIANSTNGVFQCGSAKCLPSTTNLIYGLSGGTSQSTGLIDLNGYSISVASIATAGTTPTFAGLTNSSATVGTITITGSTSTTFAALIGAANSSSNSITGTNNEALTMSGSGTLNLGYANTYTGATSVTTGVLQLGINNAVPSASDLSVSSGATFDMQSYNDAVGSLSGAGTVSTSTGSSTLTVGGNSNNTTFSGTISNGAGTAVKLTKLGTGTLTLSGTNTYTGATTVSAGTLNVTGTTASGSAVTVNSGATLAGTGTVAGAVTINGTVAPATNTTTGTLNTGAITFENPSAYTFAISNVSGTAGNANGWDEIVSSGLIAMDASSSNPLTVNVTALSGSGFNNLVSYTWIIASGASVSGSFTSTHFNIVPSGFGSYTGTFSITQTGNQINLVYTALPVNYYWNGSNATNNLTSGNLWDNNTSNNWSEPSASTFTTGSGVAWPVAAISATANFANTVAAAQDVTIPAAFTDNPINTIIGASGYTWATSGSSAINFSSPIDLGTYGLTFAPISAAPLTLTGVISDNAGITQNGAGITNLDATNTYTGTTTITAGTLQLGQSNAIPSTSDMTIAGGATFDMEHWNDAVGSLSGAGTASSSTGTSTLTAGGDNNSTTFSGVLANAGGTLSFTKSGTGTMTLSGTNTYTGTTTVSAGTLNVTGSTASGSAVTVSSGATLAGTGTVAGTVSLSGTVSPAGSNTTGILNTGAFSFKSSSAYTFEISNAGGTAGNTSGWDEIISSGAITISGSSIAINVTGLSGNGFNSLLPYTWVLATGTSISGFSASNFSINLSGLGTYTGTFSLTQTGSQINLVYTIAPAVNYFWNGSNATDNLTAGNLWDNNISNNWSEPSATAFTTGNGFAWPTASSSYIANFANAIAAAQVVTIPAALTVNPTNTLIGASGYSWLTSGSNAITFTSPIDLGTYGLTLAPVATAPLTLSGIINDNGSITQNGAGTTNLAVANTYIGSTTISAGTLQLGISNAIPSTSDLTIASGATFDMQHYNDILGSLAGAGTVSSSTGTSKLYAGGDNNSTTFSGVIANLGSSTLDFTKQGTGTMTLTGANTYSGVTTINAGILSIPSIAVGGASSPIGNATNAAANLVLGGGTLQYIGTTGSTDRNFTLTDNTTSTISVSTALTITGAAASTSGALVKAGAGVLSLSGTSLYTGGTTINAGYIATDGEIVFGANPGTFTSNYIILNGGGIENITGNISFNSNRGITLESGGGTFNALSGLSIILTNVVTGTGALTSAGPGTLIISSANTFTGGLYINNGTVQWGASGNLIVNTCPVIMDGGTLNTGATNGYSEAVGTLQLNANSSITLGSGVHQLTFANSSGLTWTTGAILTINNWGGTVGNSDVNGGQIFVGVGGLGTQQLSQIQFTGFGVGAEILNTGELVPASAITIYSQTSGKVGSDAIWATTPVGTPQTVTALIGGFNSSINVEIQNGNTVTTSSSGEVIANNLTIDAGGELKEHTTSSATPYYINIYGNLVVNGQLGLNNGGDSLALNVDGALDTISGSGVINLQRIRNNLVSTDLAIHANVNLWWSGTSLYNPTSETLFNVTVKASSTVDLEGVGDVAITGIAAASTNRGGVFTVNGTLKGIDSLYGYSLEATIGNTGFVINSGGLIAADYVLMGTGGPGDFGFTVNSGGELNVNKVLQLQSGNFAPLGTVLMKSSTDSTIAILDNFSSESFTGTYTGQMTAERYYDASYTYNQHYMGSPVDAPALSQFGASGTAGYVTDNSCSETQLTYGSDYGTVFSLNEANGGTCFMNAWDVVTSGNATDGQGYSVLVSGTGTLSLTGAPNLNSNYTLSNLTNSNWTNQSLQGRIYNSGWQLVSNPYLATLNISSTPAGFDNQIQVWNAEGPYAGSYQTSNVIAPFQAFMVRITNPTNGNNLSYTINASDRVITPQTFYAQSANQLTIVAQNVASGLMDQTIVGFNSAAADSFDAQFDADKIPGALNRQTIYTVNSGKWMSKNILSSIAATDTVPVGFEPGATGSYVLNFNGLNTFDPTSYIYLEDQTLNITQNVRNGSYTFTADSADQWNRFELLFTAPAQINTVDATCNAAGNINVQQPGPAYWNYTLTDNNNAIVTSGVLNQNQPISVGVGAGTYMLTLTDTNNYSAVKVIQVNGPETVSAAFNLPSPEVQVQQSVTLSAATSSNASSYQWNLGNGVTETGADVTAVYTEPGVYNIILTVTSQSGCTSTQTKSLKVTGATGLNNVTSTGDVNIWSHDNQIFVDFTHLPSVDATVIIYDILGQEISNEHCTGNNVYQKVIDNIDAAYMIVMVKDGDKITTKKVFISNDK